ncbi:uncharacterized protein LOC127735615 isoform X2 [Mytilus californianus]|nr:uncharacterized protein LOC127735615 isoform X2 [Mytilus californianus]
MGLKQTSSVIVSSQNETLNERSARNGRNPGIFGRLSKVFRTGRIRGIRKRALQQQVIDYGNRLEELEAVIQDKEDQIKLLKDEMFDCSKELTLTLTEKVGSNIIIGNGNILLNTDGDTHKLKDKLNFLIKICNDEFKEVAESHAELKWRMESTESILSNIDAKLELIQSTDDTNMKMLIEKITDVKSLVTRVKQDTITDDFILEAADAMKYKTSDKVVPKLGRELSKCLAVKYVARPEKIYGAFGDVGNHPLGERLTSDELANACTRWLELWMKNKRPMDLVYKLRDLEKSVIQDEAEKLRTKLQKGQKRCTSSHETASNADSDLETNYKKMFIETAQFTASTLSMHKLEMKELSDTAPNTSQMSDTSL